MPTDASPFPDIVTFARDSFGIELEWYQQEFLDACERQCAILAAMPRQAGVSLSFAVRALYKAFQQPSCHVLLVAPTNALAEHILLVCRRLWETMQARPNMEFETPLLTNLTNRSLLKFSNGARIQAITLPGLRGVFFENPQQICRHVMIESFAQIGRDQTDEYLRQLNDWITPRNLFGHTLVIASFPRRNSHFNQLWKRTLKLKTHFRPFQIFVDELSEHFQERAPRLRSFMSPHAWETQFECKVE